MWWLPTRLKVWQLLLLLPFLLWMAWDDYQDFTRLEEEGGVKWVSRTTATLYHAGGKWAVVALPLLLFAAWTWALIVTLRLHKRAEQLAAGTAPREAAPAPRKPALAPLASPPPAAPTAPRAPSAPPEGDGPRLLR